MNQQGFRDRLAHGQQGFVGGLGQTLVADPGDDLLGAITPAPAAELQELLR